MVLAAAVSNARVQLSYVGTCFLMMQESPMTKNSKAALFAVKNEDMLLAAK